MANKVIGLILPDELIQAIELRAKKTGRNKTELVVEALKEKFSLASLSHQNGVAINHQAPIT
jgi:predicted DNA-binding protein